MARHRIPRNAIKVALPTVRTPTSMFLFGVNLGASRLFHFNSLSKSDKKSASKARRSRQQRTDNPKPTEYALDIPNGAIRIPLPDLQQPDNYSCALVGMSIAKYHGLGPDSFSEFKKKLGTTPEDGTYYGKIVEYLNELGLDATVQTEMTCEQLKALLDEGIPVILSMQAYALTPDEYDDPNNNNNGHYVAAIGYSCTGRGKKKRYRFFFMDPSLICERGVLSWEELDRRWHENERDVEISHHLGIVVRPNGHKPVHKTRATRIP